MIRTLSDKNDQLKAYNVIYSAAENTSSLKLVDICLKKITDQLNNLSVYNKDLENITVLLKFEQEHIEIKKIGKDLSHTYSQLQNVLKNEESDFDSFKQYLVDQNIACESCGSILQ